MSSQKPVLIQGGMGVAVSAWPLARAVSLTGQLGVVSGTALDVVLARRLQLGDLDGHLRCALRAFPFPAMSERVLQRYYVPGGKAADVPFTPMRIVGMEPAQDQLELLVVANFVEVFLAKENHDGIVGMNLLEKIQVPTVPSLFGAMLAGVDYVLMGAGIPRHIPGALDQLSQGDPVELPLTVADAQREDHFVARFDPVAFCAGEFSPLPRPKFLAIVSSTTLASALARKANGHVDGFVIEGPLAGGHNAPPRGPMELNQRGEPVYGPRDVIDLEAIHKLGRPFWLAGSYGSPQRVAEALDEGAAGVQVGTVFAFCKESGLSSQVKQRVLRSYRAGELDVVTDPVASPTGFPFKVLSLAESLSEPTTYENRPRICDLGFLRQAYRKQDGTVGWRCPGEPTASFVRKGGQIEETEGRKCICNALVANIGLGQVRMKGEVEKPLLTCGADVKTIRKLLEQADDLEYSADDVIEFLLADVKSRGSLRVPSATWSLIDVIAGRY